MKHSKNPSLEARIQQSYHNAPTEAKEDLAEAVSWAKNKLTQHEGGGHDFYVLPYDTTTVVCSFAKPEWTGDHCSRPMPDGASAIVMAVCEYLNGA